jgi:pimeloyl-ACP methyl ester carboxylesterase
MPFYEQDGIQFHYELTGEGPTVVLCHGLTGNLEQPKQLVGFLPGYRQLLWDARGHGKTAPAGPNESFTFDRFALDLAALLDHLRIGSAVVGGISMGAAVSTRFAVRYPDRVRGLVLIRPAWLAEPLPEGLRLYPLVADYLSRFGVERGRKQFEESAGYQSLRGLFPDVAANLLGQFSEDFAIERRSRLEGIPNDAPIRNWNEVEALRISVLVVGNEPDPVHPLAYAVTWAEHLPFSRLVQVPAKSIDFEQHARSVRTHLAAFLESLPCPRETSL